MEEYRCEKLLIAKNVMFAIGTGMGAWIFSSLFLNMIIAISIGAFIGLTMLYFTLIYNNIKVGVDGKFLLIYKSGKAKYKFDTTQCRIRVKDAAGSTGRDRFLYVYEPGAYPIHIDCGMLGKKQFTVLVEDLGLTDKVEKSHKSSATQNN